MRGATICIVALLVVVIISIHAPRAGCDGILVASVLNLIIFQSTHPVRGATYACLWRSDSSISISIHAPRAGCDTATPTAAGTITVFQSTHPVRGATREVKLRRIEHAISIHAPRAGCDRYPSRLTSSARNFNPRTPCGVRLREILENCQIINFNPRTPCGVRQKRGSGYRADRKISIHAPRAGCDVDGISTKMSVA